MRFRELDRVVLTHDMPEHGLEEGDIRAIVHIHDDGETVEVEFVTAERRTVAVLTLKPENIRSIADRDILHVREYSSSHG
jgi:hypothetical protein